MPIIVADAATAGRIPLKATRISSCIDNEAKDLDCRSDRRRTSRGGTLNRSQKRVGLAR